MIAVYGLLRLGHGPFPFASTRTLKIIGAVAIAVLSWILSSRRRTASLKFERKIFIIPFCVGIMIAVYTLLQSNVAPLFYLLISILKITVGTTIAVGSWIVSSRQRVQHVQRWLETCIENIAFKEGPLASIPLSDSSSEPRQKPAAGSYVVALMAIIIIVYAAVWAFFAPLSYSIDDVVTYNPIYMYVHTGAMTFPSYDYFHSMVVHPPTHYLVLAWFMKAGIPLQYVASVPPFLLILLTVLLIVRSRFAAEIKISLLFGFFASVVFLLWAYGPTSFGMRPDWHLAFAWFAGLVALESGRLQSWDTLRLALGAFLLTYASGIHYPGSLAWTGVLVYVVWLLRDLHRLKRERGWSGALRPLLALVVGGCAFGIPYLLFFLIPYWHEILSFIATTNATAGVSASLAEHIRVYRAQYLYFPPGDFIRILYAPLAIGLPTVLISTAILLPIKQMRGLALASLPQLLFLLLFVQRKIDYRYLLPELLLYVCSLSILFAQVCRVTVTKLWPQHRRLLVPFLAVFFCGALVAGTMQEGIGTISFKPRPNTMAIARAAGRQILGSHAFVGARIGRSYDNGGDISYMVDGDLWRKFSDPELRKYFNTFDAIVEDPHMSDVPYSENKQSLSSWYAEGLLNVRGFFSSAAGIDYLLLNAHPSINLEGYELRPDGRIAHFLEQRDANWVFLSTICGRVELNKLNLPMEFESSYLLPPEGPILKQLDLLVMKRDEYQRMRSKIVSQCTIRDEVPMTMDIQDANQLLATLKDDRTIRFYPSLEEALDATRR